MADRDATLKKALIDEDYISKLALDTWRDNELTRDENLERRQLFENAWRNLVNPPKKTIWEDSSNFHVPLILIYGMATHARLWQLFSAPDGFFSVKARQQVFEERELKIKQFMDWLLKHRANNGLGIKSELDDWLWDVVFQGSGYFKGSWRKETREYLDTVTVVEQQTQTVFDLNSLTGQPIENTTTTAAEKEVVKEEVFESPQLRRMNYEDVALPLGYKDPQDSPYVVCRVEYSDDELKERVDNGTFFKAAVEDSLQHKQNIYLQGSVSSEIKQQRAETDGFTPQAYNGESHIVLEYYGGAYVEEGQVDPFENDKNVNKKKREIIAWVHMGSGEVLGWTYLYRVSPGGIRPVFKGDFISFTNRSDGIGAGELLYEISRHVDQVYNIKADSGQLASVPMFAYRASSSLKPQLMRVRPGTGIPVDDVNDIRQFNFPFLGQYGYQEESQLTGYAERLMSISDLNLGRAPQKVGALRNATGANLLASESGIQLQIHYDRLERTASRFLQWMFQITRERMSSEIYYRVTGDRGEAIFGQVDRKALGGQYDFDIAIDILSQTKTEKQQMATLAVQTLVSPATMQTGVVTPANLYNIYKAYLKAHGFTRVDDYLTPPQGYQGPVVTPAERIFRVIVGMVSGLEDTVQLNENHEAALKYYEDFQTQPEFGLIAGENQGEKLSALKRLIGRHQEYIAAINSPAAPNVSGMQMPREGFQVGGTETLQSAPVGEANGPLV